MQRPIHLQVSVESDVKFEKVVRKLWVKHQVMTNKSRRVIVDNYQAVTNEIHIHVYWTNPDNNAPIQPTP